MNDSAVNLPVPAPPEQSVAVQDAGDVTECNQMQPFQFPVAAAEGRDVTECYRMQPFVIPYAEYLCERQQLAIHLLLCGEREGKVAKKVGVSRQTIWRWRNDIHFYRALAAGRKVAFGSAIDRLRALVPEAVDRVEEQLEAGNLMAPYRVLRLAGPGPTHPDEAGLE
jgi:hypothetical protein